VLAKLWHSAKEVLVPTEEVDADTDMKRIVRSGLIVVGSGVVAFVLWSSL
jgi:hypothetical protein